MTDTETIAVYDGQVEKYAGLVDSDTPDPALVCFIARVKPGGYVLDLGCGPATSSAIMRTHNLRVDPVDASSEMVRLANETHDIGARQALFDDIGGHNIYDGVWANFALLHASPENFPRHLKAIHCALVPDGIFHLAMKLGTDAARDKLGRFYAYYSEAELADHLTHAGFSISDITTGEHPGLAGDIEPWIAMLTTARIFKMVS